MRGIRASTITWQSVTKPLMANMEDPPGAEGGKAGERPDAAVPLLWTKASCARRGSPQKGEGRQNEDRDSVKKATGE